MRLRARVRGYAGRQSVAAGERLEFFFSNIDGADLGPCPIRVVRLGLRPSEVARGLAVVLAQPVPASGWLDNHWRSSWTLDVGPDWPSGVYRADIAAAGAALGVYFVVRPAPGKPKAPMVVQLPTTTMNAYNNWGGASLYGYNSPGGAVGAVSFARPQQPDAAWPRGYGFEPEWQTRIAAFASWLEAAGYVADFITDNDLHEVPNLLDGYRLFVSIGHDEYWSTAMRDQFDRFVDAGGNAAIFGGNTCYWRIRLEPENPSSSASQLQICHRTTGADPHPDPAAHTVTWRETGYPENLSFGAGWAEGAGAWRGAAEPGAFTVWRPDHWAFEDTGLTIGDQFGNTEAEPLLGYETNGVAWRFDDQGLPVPTGTDSTPSGYEILALADLSHWDTPGNAALGVFARSSRSGLVFNAGTTDWAKGLSAAIASNAVFSNVTAKITRNVIDHLLGKRRPGGQDQA
ncbi:MAG TPA: N,N-dimethylformamidase beta subunit family domain-containing protein [Caulobacteraceae bacterium]|jgi:hypothetical protein|nr:N,N-dimethylformamidase beta subunit family domain-containing protein [Caulobacteraceae bacterium]